MNTSNIQSKDSSESLTHEIASSRPDHSYHEIPGLRHETKDVLKQMDLNIRSLEDQIGRLGFVLAELRSLIRR